MKDKLYIMRDPTYMSGLNDLINYIKQSNNTAEMTMIEIGSYAGESTQLFAKNFKKVISIDPFINNYDPNDITCSYMELDKVYDTFKMVINKHNNIEHIRLTSDGAIGNLSDLKVDFVYIDGLHTYDQVKKDINNYIKLLNPNCFIGGHDFHPVYQPVKNGIIELLGEPDKLFSDTSWIKLIK